MPHLLYILFFFALGACIGSFLNVVAWRYPRGESLVTPPSRCPKCGHRLAWRDNIPVFGWIFLRGKCRYCSVAISPRYPTVEAICGVLFALYYIVFFVAGWGLCSPEGLAWSDPTGDPPLSAMMLTRPMFIGQDWPIFGLVLFMISCLLAVSLIDFDLFIIPTKIPYMLAGLAFIVHTIIDTPRTPGALNLGPIWCALSLGGGIGLLVSLCAWRFKILPTSFPQGEPILQIEREEMVKEIEEAKRAGTVLNYEPLPPEYTRPEIRTEIAKEMIFLMPPLVLAGVMLLVAHFTPLRGSWVNFASGNMVSGFLGALLGALVGAFTVWFFRIIGTIVFGRVAMGLGDVHLMFGVGAVIGAMQAVVAFFIAPFFGILIALYMFLTKRHREVPYGPYLSLGAAFVMIFYCPIWDHLKPGIQGLIIVLSQMVAS